MIIISCISRAKKQKILFASTLTLLALVSLYFTLPASNDTTNQAYHSSGESKEKSVVCVLVLACNRPSVKKCLDSVFRSRDLTKSVDFPVIVSQDCGKDVATTKAIESYGTNVLHIYQPDQREIIAENKNTPVGYYKQTRHYKWALDRAFNHYQCPYVISLEDDVEVSLDFFEYFAALVPIYEKDASIFCITASSCQAKPGLIDTSALDLLHRTDFFFGWGWMISKEIFTSIIGNWPKVYGKLGYICYWDTYMGRESVKARRACIRPEIPRVKNFGRFGTSGLKFYEERVKDLVFNTVFVPFTKMNLTYLTRARYDKELSEKIAHSLVVPNLESLENKTILPGPPESSIRIYYKNHEEFRKIGTFFGLDTRTWNGIAHTEYKGILTCMYKGRRIYIVPQNEFRTYDPQYDYDN